jgi:predicted TIM-barrel fold metal-dependent hydrolase
VVFVGTHSAVGSAPGRRPLYAAAMAVPVIDADTHLFETRTLWADHLPVARRPLALRIEDDELGYAWLTAPHGERIHLAEVHTPGDIAPMGERRIRQRAGAAPAVPFDELPARDRDPAARVQLMDEQGVDEALVFPNFGLFWVRTLEDQPEAQLANMEAWNRWAVDGIAPGGAGRLHPVGHVSLRDPDWLDVQLGALAAGGVTTAMVPVGPVDGMPFSHPDLKRCWSMFEDHGVGVIFHISDGPRPFADAWYEDDVNQIEPMLMSTFIAVTPQLALTDLAVGGVLARHPRLRVGLVEFTSSWFGPFLSAIDACYRFHATYNGLPVDRMKLPPSEYLRRQVRVAAFGFERPAELAEAFGDLYMFGSDYPHAEGSAHPLEDFVAAGGPERSRATAGLFHDNAAWLLGR